MKKHTKVILGSIFVLGGIVVAFLRAGNQQSPQAGFQRPPASVAVAMAIAQDVPVYLDEIGKCVAREMVSIQPQVSGRITRIQFADGANVKAGDTLFTIDPRPYHAMLQVAEADLEQAKSALVLAKIQFERSEKLLESKDISQSDYDTAKNGVEIAEAQVKRSEAAVENARLNLEYCFIRSPIDGRAGRRLIDIGNVVAPSSGSLLTIQRIDPIYADFIVNENDLAVVQKNMAQGALRAEVRLPDLPDSISIGKLTFLDNAVQSGTGTVELRATVPNSNYRLWPGQFVKVRLVLNTIHNAVLIPSAASQMSAKGPIVFVVKGDATAELRPVVLGQRQGDFVVITQGVNAGDQVIISGQMAVAPGAKVHIAESQDSGSQTGGNKGTNS
jgi:membrane fusion protein, multidrug efflux system